MFGPIYPIMDTRSMNKLKLMPIIQATYLNKKVTLELLKKDESLVIPNEIDYDSFSGLSNEVK